MHTEPSSRDSLELSDRVAMLHAEVLSTQPALCAERALLVTRFFRDRRNRRGPVVLQKARALSYVLSHKAALVYPQELLVGRFTAQRVGGGIVPELHGLAVLEDLFVIDRRKLNPLRISQADRVRLLREVVPFWLPRFFPFRAFRGVGGLRFMADQMQPTSHLINETGGISHFVPDYDGLVRHGTDGFRERARARLAELPPNSDKTHFLRAVAIVCDGLDAFSEGYRKQAQAQAQATTDEQRRQELLEISRVCERVPRRGARTFREALQSILFAQIALNLESLDNSVSPGRLDQILYPLYRKDIEEGRLDRAEAFELLGCFAVKLCEIVPVFSRRISRFHGGMFNGQVLVVGGTDEEGHDATNDLTLLFVELMRVLRTRQPNYHARLHASSPTALKRRVASALAAGAASPAVYNDEVVVQVVRSRGIPLAHARDYANVGCVEPVPAARGFLSTDAALVNLPLCLELALNRGRRFGHRRRTGAKTAANAASVEEIFALFDAQVSHAIERLLPDLRAIERANARLHPTPLTSTLLRGCIESAQDASAGGAMYNGSGIQGVGAVEVGDSLAALDAVVFREGRADLG